MLLWPISSSLIILNNSKVYSKTSRKSTNDVKIIRNYNKKKETKTFRSISYSISDSEDFGQIFLRLAMIWKRD